ncbi:hypothetical protein D3C85_1520830 [compost metagenome]
MKIFAGGKFQNRNPATAVASTMTGQSNSTCPIRIYTPPIPKQAQMASALASPSMPSMKL